MNERSTDAAASSSARAMLVPLTVVSMVVWGGSWVSAKLVSTELSAESLIFWRFLITAAALAPFLWFFREPVRLTRDTVIYTLLGAVCLGAYSYVFFTGLRKMEAGAAGVIVTTITPVITFAIAAVFLKEKISKRALMGLMLGVAGGLILVHAWEIKKNLTTMSGGVAFIVCSVCWASLTVCGKKASEGMSPVMFSFLSTIVCCAAFVPLSLRLDMGLAIEEGGLFWFNMIYLGALSGAAATTVYFYASSRLGPGRAASFSYLVPVCALGLSFAFLGERPEATTMIGGAIAIIAVYLINSGYQVTEKEGV